MKKSYSIVAARPIGEVRHGNTGLYHKAKLLQHAVFALLWFNVCIPCCTSERLQAPRGQYQEISIFVLG